MPDTNGESYVNASVSVADLSPNVATHIKVLNIPEDFLHKMEVPDVQSVLSHLVEEIRIILLKELKAWTQIPVTVSSCPPTLRRFNTKLCPSEEIETASKLRDIDNDPT